MKKIAFTGGGTGGHITPIISIYNTIKDKAEFFWIGESSSLEEKIAKENSIKFYPIKAGKLRRYFSLKTLLEPFNIITGIITSYNILKKEKPNAIFSKGGHVSLPVAIASKFLNIPLYLHESDTIPGLANRFVGKFAVKIYLGFEMASKYFDENKTEIAGQILNPELFDNLGEIVETKNNNTNLLIIAGSQGSRRIFKNILENMDYLQNFNIYIVLGSLNINMKKDFERFSNCYVYEFINQKELAKIMDITDVAITRSGATSLAELEAFGVKLIMIPLKESANNHQYFNALEYQNKGKGEMIEENNIDSLINIVSKLRDYKKEKSALNKQNITDIISQELLK